MTQPIDFRVYPYSNGLTRVFADPFRILRELAVLLNGDPREVLEAARKAVPRSSEGQPVDSEAEKVATAERAMAQIRLADATKQAFELTPFDKMTGTGFTDDEALELLYDFVAWLKKKQTNGVSPPPSAKFTAEPLSSVMGRSPQKPPWVSSSTPNDCDCA